jgi:signal peptidase I
VGEVLRVVIFALAIIVPVRYFLVQPFYVKGASMEPTFHDAEYLIIDEITYRFRSPDRGEVVVLHNPTRPSEFFIKRVIGLPGEHLEVTNGHVRITNSAHPTGFTLDETGYLEPSVTTTGNQTADLGPGQFYVFGDNRSYSLDSRSFGPVDRKTIVGRVWIRAWPFDRLMQFSPPHYTFVTL